MVGVVAIVGSRWFVCVWLYLMVWWFVFMCGFVDGLCLCLCLCVCVCGDGFG